MSIEIGMTVEIGLQSDRTRKLRSRGIVEEVLSKNQNHPHGVLVKLDNGSVGRVVKSSDETLKQVKSFNADKSKIQYSVLELITQEESTTLEFKSSFSWCMKENKRLKYLENVILKSISSLANTDGGVLLIGIDDGGEIVGLEGDYSLTPKKRNRDGFELRLTDKLINAFTISTCKKLFDIAFHNFEDGKEICIISVERSIDPLFVTDENGRSSQAFVRVGNSTRALPAEQIIGYFSDRKRSV